jgi:type III secretion protein HrpB1
MTATAPDYLNCSPDVIGGLIETVSTALLDNFPKLSADPYDVELLLDALRVLRPKVAEIDTLDGILHMVRGHWDEAIHVLRQVGENAPRFGYAKALLAFSLSAKGDPDWKQCATEAMATNPTRDTEALVRALNAREDLLNAMRVNRRGGQFMTPPSVTALEVVPPSEPTSASASADVQPAAAPQPAVAFDAVHNSAFMRA